MVSVTITSLAEKGEVTRLFCRECGEKLRGVALQKGSSIKGLTFVCKRCRKVNAVETK